MAFGDNFVQVPAGRSTLIDPTLKIRLATGRWNPESSALGGSVDVALFHDPEIVPGRLTMPPSDKIKRNREMLGAPPLAEVVFQSDRCKEIAKTSVDVEQIDDEVALICRAGSEPTFKYTAKLIEMANIDAISEHPWQIIRYMLESIPSMPLWVDEFAAKWGSKRISLYVDRRLAEELSTFANFHIGPDEGDLVRISTLDIAA